MSKLEARVAATDSTKIALETKLVIFLPTWSEEGLLPPTLPREPELS